MATIIIIGAASGMGKALAQHYIQQKNIVAVVDKNLTALKSTFSYSVPANLIAALDVVNSVTARHQLLHLVQKMGRVDTLIYTAAIADKSGIWENELQQHHINAIGFAAVAHAIFYYFKENNIKGQIVGFSSVLAYRGMQQATPYCAGKCFVRCYMQGLRHTSKANNLGITITEICPGFVQTPMISNQQNTFWITPLAKATMQIIKAVDNKKQMVFVSKRWGIIAGLLYCLPNFIFHSSLINSLFIIKNKKHEKAKVGGFGLAINSCNFKGTSHH
jgi:short-subunit dehydrogenase